MNECKVLAAVGADSVPFSSPRILNENAARADSAGPNVSRLTPKRSINSGLPEAAKRPAIEAETILKSFNSRAFRREQPSDPQLMLRIISDAAAVQAPLPFVLYWGKGPRSAIAQPDIECLDFLAAFAQRVRQGYAPGATIKLILTDTHAELNGHPPTGIQGYFGDIEAGELTRAAAANVGPIDYDMPKDMEERLAASAKKWFRGEGTAEDGARKYYRINMLELRAVELAFPGSIFITYNSPDFRSLCPARLPVFYMYTLRRGYRIKPWFLPVPAMS
jgi:hypothetical protein